MSHQINMTGISLCHNNKSDFFTFSDLELGVRGIFFILSIFWYILQQTTVTAAILDLTFL